jgi:hypothetical protein
VRIATRMSAKNNQLRLSASPVGLLADVLYRVDAVLVWICDCCAVLERSSRRLRDHRGDGGPRIRGMTFEQDFAGIGRQSDSLTLAASGLTHRSCDPACAEIVQSNSRAESV